MLKDRRGSGWVIALAFAGLAGCGDRPQVFSTGLAIVGVSVIDPIGERLLPDRTVVVQGNRIAAVAPTAELELADGVRRIDGAGRFLLPGLWDMHVHAVTSSPDLVLPIFVANGVTGIRDMWGDLDSAAVLRGRIAAGELVGPRMLVAGAMLDGTEPWIPGSTAVPTVERARSLVDSLAAGGADFIKVYSLLTPEVYRAILERADSLGLSVAGHVPMRVPVREASALGHASMAHLFGVMDGCASTEAEVMQRRASWLDAAAAGDEDAPNPFFDPGLYRVLTNGFDESRCRELVAALASNGTWQVPTLVAMRGAVTRDDAELRADPRRDYLSAWSRELWRWMEGLRAGQDSADDEAGRAFFDLERRVVGIAAEEGVSLMAGSDAPNPHAHPGFGLHDELALFVEAGMTPAQALRAATIEPARFLNATDSLGAVEVGRIADLVLLSADPLADIRNTTRIEAVIANGRLYERTGLDEILRAAQEMVGEGG